jgi:hypothetical protein
MRSECLTERRKLAVPRKAILTLGAFVLATWTSIAVSQTKLGDLLDMGASRLSSPDFRRELVGRAIAGQTPAGQNVEVVYIDNGDLRGSGSATISGGATGGGQTYDISGTWTADDTGGICTRLNLGRLTLPPRCQYWYRYGGQYFLSDSAEDRSARVLRRTVKQ